MILVQIKWQGLDLSSYMKQSRKKKMHNITDLKIRDKRQWETVILRDYEIKSWSLWVPEPSALSKFLGCVGGRRNLARSMTWRDGVENVGNQGSKSSQRIESSSLTEHLGECRGLPLRNQLNADQWMLVRKVPKTEGKEPRKGWELTHLVFTQGQEYSQTGRPHDSRALSQVLKVIL